MIVGALREPRSQGREPREAGGRRVCNARVAEKAPARLAAVGINRRIEPAHVAGGARNTKPRSISPSLRRAKASRSSRARAVILRLRASWAARKVRTNSAEYGGLL